MIMRLVSFITDELKIYVSVFLLFIRTWNFMFSSHKLCIIEALKIIESYVISSVAKFTIVLIKFSRMMTDLIAFQSVVGSPSNKQIDSSASFTGAGGLAIDLTSTKCCFFMDFTANHRAKIK